VTRIITRFPNPTPSTWLALAIGATLATTVAAGWGIVHQTRFENARAERSNRMSEIVGALRQNGLSGLKAASRDIAAHAPGYLSGDVSDSGRILSRMEGEVSITDADLGFLLDSAGRVRLRIQQPGEIDILGSDLSFRRYFKKARLGQEDEFGALGAFTHKRGIYASCPVRGPAGQFLGTAVFRFPASTIEDRWLALLSDPAALISPEGVVFASNQPSWRLTTVIDEDSTIHRVAASRQYGDSLPRLGVDLRRDRAHWNDRNQTVLRAELPGGWMLVSLLPDSARHPLGRAQWGAVFGIAAAWLFLVVLGAVVVVGLQRIRRDEQDKNRLSKRLEEAERLESLGRLAGGVAHDFNNVLTAIIGYASVLEYKLPPDGTEKDLARRVGAAAKRASETVRQLMAFARRSGLQVKPIGTHDLLRELAASLDEHLASGMEIRLDLRATRDVIIADPGHIQQALANLAHNARDAMPNGGSLTFSTSLVETGSGKMLEIRSTDNGPGIPSELLPHIFEPFFTTKKGGRGTGLGLASVWGTVQRHGGSIAVESQANQGTEFRIRLPLAPEGVEAERTNKGVHAPQGTRRLRILALDDDREVREAMETMVVAQGHQIDLFSDFNGLWKRMKEGTNMDLLVLDLDMPGIDGIDALKRIRISFPELPVMVASGHLTTSAMQELKHLGVETFLRKPFGAQDLGLAIDRASLRGRG